MDGQKETLNYYDSNAEKFVADTVDVEFGSLQQRFADMLPAGGCILDLGCGSGRDSLAFIRQGFQVDAVDGSAAMCANAHALTGLDVTHATFQEYEPKSTYDGIWACSSLLHVPAEELPGLLAKYAGALKSGGAFYLSFKLGEHEGMRNGRWFTDLTEETFRKLVGQVEGLEVTEIDITADVRPGRSDEKWLNTWCLKS